MLRVEKSDSVGDAASYCTLFGKPDTSPKGAHRACMS